MASPTTSTRRARSEARPSRTASMVWRVRNPSRKRRASGDRPTDGCPLIALGPLLPLVSRKESEEGRRGEDDLVREAHLASHLAERLDLRLESRPAPGPILALLSLDVVVGTEEAYGVRRGRPPVDGDEVHAGERGQRLGPEILGEDRPAL